MAKKSRSLRTPTYVGVARKLDSNRRARAKQAVNAFWKVSDETVRDNLRNNVGSFRLTQLFSNSKITGADFNRIIRSPKEYNAHTKKKLYDDIASRRKDIAAEKRRVRMARASTIGTSPRGLLLSGIGREKTDAQLDADEAKWVRYASKRAGRKIVGSREFDRVQAKNNRANVAFQRMWDTGQPFIVHRKKSAKK